MEIPDKLSWPAELPPHRENHTYSFRRLTVSSRFVLAVLFTFVLGLTSPVFAQHADNAVPAATTTATGKLVFTFTVTVDSAVPKNGVLVCSASANVESYSQKAIGIVNTPVAGKNTCVVNMPYSWMLATQSTDKIALGATAEVDYGYEVTAENGTATVVVPAVSDKVGANLPSISVPTAASTSIAVSTTI
jgi:hypothetical protein